MTAPEHVGLALRLYERGYPPTLVLRHDALTTIVGKNGEEKKQSPGKQPHGWLWSRKETEVYAATPAKIAAWARLRDIGDHPGLGIACGKVVCCDIDVYDPEQARWTERLARSRLGDTPLRRVGRWPKVALVYRTAGRPISKTQSPELFKVGVKAKVEVLRQGQQFVAFGIHPETREPYTWDGATPETTPLAELPAVTQEQVDAFVADAERWLRVAGYRTKAEIDAGSEAPPHVPKPANGHGNLEGFDFNDAPPHPKPWKIINKEAMAQLSIWVPRLFPGARPNRHGVYRIKPADLGTPEHEEDLSIAPAGIADYRVHDQGDPKEGKRTPIDLVIEHGGVSDALQAARWLAERLGLEHLLDGDRRQKSTNGGGRPDADGEDHAGSQGEQREQRAEATSGDPDASWPEPEPLSDTEEPEPFPLDALPPDAGAAVVEYQAYGQQPVEMVACAALAAMGGAVQGLVDVRRDAQLVGPTSINVVLVAESGERKTACDEAFAKAAQRWERAEQKRLAPMLEQARENRISHDAVTRGIRSAMTDAGKRLHKDDKATVELARLKQELDAHWPTCRRCPPSR
jgi:hypothetical protein